jgi:putative ABC transport system permease protein
MEWPRVFASRLRGLFRKRHLDRDLDAELRAHLGMLAEENIRRGMSPAEASYAARREFGGVEQAKELYHEQRGLPFLETLLQDVRYALRLLGKSPGFTAVAVLTLALGIGANAAIFGLVDSALLRALPFREPERLVHVWKTDAGGDLHTPSPAEYLGLQKNSRSFEEITGSGWADYFYGDDESAWQSLPGSLVTANWLPTLGIQPILGRNFFEEEQVAGQDTVVILSYGCWRARFHADTHIVGKQISLNRRTVTIVGVMPQSIGRYYEDIEIFAPLILDAYASQGKLRAGTVRVRIVARLKPGVTLDQARSEAEVIAQQLRGPRPEADRSGHLVVQDFTDEFRHLGPTSQNARRGLWMMAAAAGVVLLIACANVASLLLARGVKRYREIAVRAALGCSRQRMIRQLLTESALLFLCGGSLGLVVARWSQEIITKAAAGMVPNGTYLEIDARVFSVSLAVSLLSALVFGMIPALSVTRVNLGDSLKDAARNEAGGSRSRRPRNLLVAFQIALAMMLLVGFGLLFRSLRHVESAAVGYDPRNVLTATIQLPALRYADPAVRARWMREGAERVRLMPSVESVGITDSLPMEGADSARLRVEAPSSKAAPTEEEIWFLSVSPEYFSTLKVPMLAGRPFRDADIHESSPVAIINQTFARQYFPGANPVGYHLAFGDSPTTWREIVGVVSDFRQRNPEEDLRPLAYFPLAQTLPGGRWSMAIRVRTSSDMLAAIGSLSKWLQPVDPQLYWELGNMQQQIHDSESLTLRRPLITLLASFGALAIVLAIVGVFGVSSYSVTERTREIGIRVALGAARREIVGLVLRETLVVTLAGLALGTLGALVLTRFFPTGPIGWSGSGIFLYGVSRTDALTYTCAAALLAIVTLVASWVPARRASRLDPLVALRYE